MAYLTPVRNGSSKTRTSCGGRSRVPTRQVIRESGIDPHEILGIGISAQMWNTLPVDERGTPLMPMMSWLDLRSVKQADRVGQGEMAALIYKHTGNIPTAKDSIPKILWLKRGTTRDLEAERLICWIAKSTFYSN